MKLNITTADLTVLLKKHLGFIISFIFTKGTVYLVPLLLADILSANDFGVLEYSLAGLGFVLNSLIGLGVPGGYPFFILRKKDYSIQSGFLLHSIWLLIVFLVNQGLLYYNLIGIEYYMAINISYIIANQVFYSTKLKCSEKPTSAIFLDSGVYIIIAILLILYSVNWLSSITLNVINFVIFIYAIVYCVFGIYSFFKNSNKNSFKNYIGILKYSINVMFGTFLIFLITSSGRILAEYFFTFKEVAVYGFYFRLSAIVVMIYQMINIIFFKKIYTLDPKSLDKYYSLFFIFIFILTCIFYLLMPLVLIEFSEFFSDTFHEHKSIYFLLCVQMLMWIATALNSSIIDRENLVVVNNIKFAILIFSSFLCLFLLKDRLTLTLLVLIHYTVIFISTIIQYYSLSKRNINFKKSKRVLIVSYLISIFFYFII